MKRFDPDLLKQDAFIDGAWEAADDGARYVVHDPATGAALAEVADLGAAETDRAIAAAQAAFAVWRDRPAKQRAAVLRAWYDLIIRHQEDLGLLMTMEQGKPLAEAIGEVQYGASFVEWFAEEAKRAYGEIIPAPAGDRRLMVLKQPVGVVAAITPWNFPVAMITRKVAPALAAGCTVVVKPAEATPLSALALAELARRAGVPHGVLNIVTTSRPAVIAAALTSSKLVRKLSFTGSTAVGKLLLTQCAGTVKRVSMELGGNAPFIVFADADLDLAVSGAMASKYRNAGQTCICANRLLVQDTVYDEFAQRLAAAAQRLTVGPGTQDGVQIGPLIDARAVRKVERLVGEAVGAGATAMAGGARHAAGPNFYAPTVLRDVTSEMAIAREEIFGPVATLIRFGSDDEAVALANDTSAGLAAYVYTGNLRRAWRITERLEYGMVGLNESLISNEVAPFGGVKESGLGREGSRHGLDEYLELKYVCQGGLPA